MFSIVVDIFANCN